MFGLGSIIFVASKNKREKPILKILVASFSGTERDATNLLDYYR
jgi:hypothetical protein